MATLTGTRRNPNPRLGDIWTQTQTWRGRGSGSGCPASSADAIRWRVIENVGGDEARGGRVLLQVVDGDGTAQQRQWVVKEDLRRRATWRLSARRCTLGIGAPDGQDGAR